MAQFSGLTVVARNRARVSLYGIYGGQSGTGIGFPRVLRFSAVAVIPWLSILMYHLGDEQ
jgi:hypothetical protein